MVSFLGLINEATTRGVRVIRACVFTIKVLINPWKSSWFSDVIKKRMRVGVEPKIRASMLRNTGPRAGYLIIDLPQQLKNIVER